MQTNLLPVSLPLPVEDCRLRLSESVIAKLNFDKNLIYCDPMIGSGAISFLAANGCVAEFSDHDRNLIEFYKAVQSKKISVEMVIFAARRVANHLTTCTDPREVFRDLKKYLIRNLNPIEYYALRTVSKTLHEPIYASGIYAFKYNSHFRYDRLGLIRMERELHMLFKRIQANPQWSFKVAHFYDIAELFNSNHFLFLDPPMLFTDLDRTRYQWDRPEEMYLYDLLKSAKFDWALLTWEKTMYKFNHMTTLFNDDFMSTTFSGPRKSHKGKNTTYRIYFR